LFFAVIVALGSGILVLGDNKYLVDYHGVADIKISTDYDRVYKLKPADLAVYRQNRQRLVDLILAQPGVKSPHGVSLIGLARACPPLALEEPDHPAWPVPTICIIHCNSIFERDGKPDWGSDSPVEMTVYLNDPENSGFQNYGGEKWTDSKGRTIYYQANRVGDIQGFSVYRPRNQGDKEILILSQNRKPIWLPLSNEEFLNAWIRRMEKDLAEDGEYGKDPSFPPRMRLERHRAVLAAMSPAERQAQAMYLRHDDAPLEPELALKGSPYAWPLVIVNPEWFDPALPRSAVQLISVQFNYATSFDPDGPQPDDDGGVESLRLSSMKSTCDWKAIGSLLGH
jgi:hypothetical protein